MIDYAEKAKNDFNKSEFEDFEERAGILEFDGGYPKEEAEKRAYMMILTEKRKK